MDIKLADKDFVENFTLVEVTDKEADSYIKNTVPSMIEFVKERNGLGLAAPQVGVPKKFFIAKDLESGEFIPYFNAWYVKDGSRIKSEEGCLSYPEEDVQVVKRFKSIKLIYQVYTDKGLRGRIAKVSGEQAIIFQHECDHIKDKNRTIFVKGRK